MAVHLHSEEHGETMRQAYNWPPVSPAPAAPEAPEASAAETAASAPAPETPPAPEPEPAPEPPEEEDVPAEEEEEAEEAEEAPTAEVSTPETDLLTPGMQKRINRMTRRLRDREREIASQQDMINGLRAQMETLTQLVAGQRPPANETQTTGEQDLREEDFSSYGEFARAVARQEARREAQALVEAEMARQREARQAEVALQAQQSLVQQWNQGLTVARQRFEDFDEVVDAAQHQVVSEAVLQAIRQSPAGGVLYYHLASHPDELNRLSQLSEWEAYREVGKLEARLSADPPASTLPPGRVLSPPRLPTRSTPAVRPITPVGGGANAAPVVDRSTLPPKDYYKLRAKEGVPQR